MRSLLSEMRAKPPRKWLVQVRSRAATKTPKTLTKKTIGKRTTGTEAILLSLALEVLGRDPEKASMATNQKPEAPSSLVKLISLSSLSLGSLPSDLHTSRVLF